MKQNKLNNYLKSFFALSLALALTGCYSSNQTNQTVQLPAQNEEPDFSVSAPNINLANPLIVSQKAEDVTMCAEINEKIEKSAAANARWGVFAVSLKDGRVLCERDGRKLFNPASIQKTLTTIVGLDKLGADFRWKTSVYGANQIDADGNLSGDLTVYGEGAPDFDSAALDNLIAQLQNKNLKRITGDVIGDSSYFRGDAIGDGWTWNELQWYYGAEAAALSFNDNQAFINVENGEGKATTDYLTVTVGNPTPIAAASNAEKIANYEAGGIKRGLDNNDFYVWGNSKNFGARVSVHNPAGLAAKSFKEALEKKGIRVDGKVRSLDWKSANTLDVSKSQELASVQSAPLAEIVKRMNKHSVNLYAELILRTIGKKFSSEVPDNIQLPQSVRGDDIAGAAIIKKWLLAHHIAAEEVQISDGSGLSRLDFVTPESFARAFIYAAQSNYAQAFTDSLPISGTDGTLGGRLSKAKGKVLAKTGSISFVNSLAGYAERKDGEIITFAVITNNETRKNIGVGVIDSIVLRLIGEPNSQEKRSEKPNKVNRNADANKSNFVVESGKGI
jgi:D-alanyl-D-alanine carboxypeptidase/D-alanyl-D-alanine-endopeptidase (penicillin-binding protein 4)